MYPDGRLLLRVGTVLTDRHIDFLVKQDIRTLHVRREAASEAAGNVSDEVFESRRRRLEGMFEGLEGAPHMDALREAALRQLRRTRPWEDDG